MDRLVLMLVVMLSVLVTTNAFTTSRLEKSTNEVRDTEKLINLLTQLRNYYEDLDEEDGYIDDETSLDDLLFNETIMNQYNEDQAAEILYEGDEYIEGYDELTHFFNLEEDWFLAHDNHLGSGNRVHQGMKRNFDEFTTLWPNAQVPYTTRNFQEPRSIKAIKEAATIIGRETCINVVERGSSNAQDYLTFDGASGGCASYVGKTGSQQIVNIEEPGCATPDTVIHEIMHAIGQQHEQSRGDRARYISILWKQIHKDNYVNYGKEMTVDNVAPYDYFSTLQYALGNEMKIPNPRLAFLTSAAKTLSHYDVKEMVNAYKCDATCGSTTCENTGFPRKTVAVPSCACRCPDGLKGASCNEKDGDSDCGGIIKLNNGESRNIKAPGYDTGTYTTGKECIWFIRGEGTNARIKVEVQELDIVASTTTCPHFLSMHYTLVGQPGVNLCNKLTSPKTFVKSVSVETNMFLMKFSSKRSANSNSGKKGFKLQVSAYQSGCELKLCRNYVTCTDQANADYVCACQVGYSGKNCDVVAANAVVTCNLETDFEGDCCVKNVKTITNARWFEQGKGYNGQQDVYAKEGTVFARPLVPGIGNKAKLQTELTFAAGQRCLQFTALVQGARTGEAPSTLEVFTAAGSVENKIRSISETTSNNWQEFKISIADLSGKKIVFVGTVGNTMLAIDNIIISKECDGSGASACANTPCKNGGVCTGSGASYTCECQSGFRGSTCEIADKPCDAKPCQNNGQCLNKESSGSVAYTCVCVDGYTGTNCETAGVASCTADQWKCTDGKCIAKEFRCDWRIKHCNDESDEKGCTDHCLSKPCKNGGQCQNEKSTFKCTCANGFAGTTCTDTLTCTSAQFKCANGEKCIVSNWRCDKVKDCDDNSDELHCGCDADTEFACGSGECIHKEWKCDLNVDCSDESDETGCSSACDAITQFTCDDGECINKDGICDQTAQCFDGSDETGCSSACDAITQFTCDDGECINKDGICDQTAQCFDGSDETGCSASACDANNQFTCDDGECIPKEYRCDGTYGDCSDESDENGCPASACDANNQFTCDDGECIPKEYRCDGTYVDCSDQSDENGCPARRSHLVASLVDSNDKRRTGGKSAFSRYPVRTASDAAPEKRKASFKSNLREILTELRKLAPADVKSALRTLKSRRKRNTRTTS